MNTTFSFSPDEIGTAVNQLSPLARLELENLLLKNRLASFNQVDRRPLAPEVPNVAWEPE